MYSSTILLPIEVFLAVRLISLDETLVSKRQATIDARQTPNVPAAIFSLHQEPFANWQLACVAARFH